MAYIIKMPKLGMGMNEGTLLEWFASPGDGLTEGDVIAEIESEKTVAEIAASEDGVLRRVYVQAGETVDPGAALGIVAEPDEDISALEAKVDRDPVESEAGTAAASATAGRDPEPSTAPANGGAGQTGRIRASPKAKQRASELDVELADVEGSGPGGAVILSDIESATTTSGAAGEESGASAGARAHGGSTSVDATPKARRRARHLGVDLGSVDGSGTNGAVTATDLPTPGDGTADATGSSVTGADEPARLTPVEERELDGMRRTIAKRLGESYREAVHVTVHRRIDMEEALAATEVVDEYVAADATVTDVVLVALSATLEEHPEFNAREVETTAGLAGL